MLRVLVGAVVGAYIAQTYEIPNIKTSLIYLQESLVEYEKALSKTKEK